MKLDDDAIRGHRPDRAEVAHPAGARRRRPRAAVRGRDTAGGGRGGARRDLPHHRLPLLPQPARPAAGGAAATAAGHPPRFRRALGSARQARCVHGGVHPVQPPVGATTAHGPALVAGNHRIRRRTPVATPWPRDRLDRGGAGPTATEPAGRRRSPARRGHPLGNRDRVAHLVAGHRRAKPGRGGRDRPGHGSGAAGRCSAIVRNPCFVRLRMHLRLRPAVGVTCAILGTPGTRSPTWRWVMELDGRLIDRPGMSTPGEDAAWRSLRERVVISLRPVGAPTSIGFFGLAAASLPFSGLQLGWVRPEQGHQVALVMIGFAFLAQALAAVFSLLARDGTAATAMATLALTWLVVGWVMVTTPPGTTSGALGLLLIFSGCAMTLIAVTAALSKLVPAVVFLVAALRFFTTAGYHLSGATGWVRTGGVSGLILFLLAMYAAWATNLEDAVGRTVLPLGRRGKGKTAVTGSLLEQTKEVVTEPGVREQL